MILPKYWHYSRWESDRVGVMRRMAVIPEEKQREVAVKYDNIFLDAKPDSRKRANDFLTSVAIEYRDKNAK